MSVSPELALKKTNDKKNKLYGFPFLFIHMKEDSRVEDHGIHLLQICMTKYESILSVSKDRMDILARSPLTERKKGKDLPPIIKEDDNGDGKDEEMKDSGKFIVNILQI